MLDGRSANGHFWVLFGALSDVEYTITVVDTTPGAVKTYYNPPRHLGSFIDILAFTDRPAASELKQSASLNELKGTEFVLPEEIKQLPRTSTSHARALVGCATSGDTLCVQGGRFQIKVDWKNYNDGSTGKGTAAQLTSDTGYFWFFDSGNLELVIKILDGRSSNGRFWVLYGALSDVEYTIRVTDTQTGAVKTYHNDPHQLSSVIDISAF